MSCPGDNYVVPGANPCAGGGGAAAGVNTLQSLSGDINFQSTGDTVSITTVGNNVNLESVGSVYSVEGLTGDVTFSSNNGSITINNITGDINLEVTNTSQNPISNSITNPANIFITSVAQSTAHFLSEVQIITTAASSGINITGNIVISTTSLTQNDFSFYIEKLYNGVITQVGLVCTSSLGGVGRFLTCPIIVNTTSAAGATTFYLRAYASSASVFTVESSEFTAIGNLTATSGTRNTLALPTVTPSSVINISGGLVFDCGSVTGLPTIDPALNPFVTFVLTMCGTGSSFTGEGNDISVGIVENLTTPVAAFFANGTPAPSVNWGTSIPNGLNQIVYQRLVPYASYIGTLNYYAFLSFPNPPPPNYQFLNLAFQLTVIYNS